jgi:peptidoglycan hydrolase CwlO-like protein
MYKIVHTEPLNSIVVHFCLVFSSTVNNTMLQLDTVCCQTGTPVMCLWLPLRVTGRKGCLVTMQMKPEDTARLAALKKEMSAAEAELAKLKKDAAGLVGQAEKLQGRIDNAGGVKMKQQKQEVSALQQVTNIRM